MGCSVRGRARQSCLATGVVPPHCRARANPGCGARRYVPGRGCVAAGSIGPCREGCMWVRAACGSGLHVGQGSPPAFGWQRRRPVRARATAARLQVGNSWRTGIDVFAAWDDAQAKVGGRPPSDAQPCRGHNVYNVLLCWFTCCVLAGAQAAQLPAAHPRSRAADAGAYGTADCTSGPRAGSSAQ
jgi:hypothetical protein